MLKMTLEQGSWLITLWLLAHIPGCLVGGYIADRFGRRPIIVGISMLFPLSFVLIAVAYDINFIYVSRIISGFADGSLYSILPVYISEISHSKLRGSMSNLVNIGQSLGILLVYIIGIFVTWRQLHWLFCIPSCISVVLSIILLPEAPYWLLKEGRSEEAQTVLKKLRGGSSKSIQQEFNEMVNRNNINMKAAAAAAQDKGCAHKLISAFCSSSFLRPFSRIGVLYCIVQFSGVNIAMMYLVTIFQQSGSNIDPYIQSIIVSGFRMVTSLMSSLALAMFPRRALFACSALLIAASMAIIGTVSFYNEQNLSATSAQATINITSGTHFSNEHEKQSALAVFWGWLPAIAIMVIYVNHSLGYASVIRVLVGEMFPTEIRAMSSASWLCGSDMCLAIVGKLFPQFITWLGFHGTFWTYRHVCC